MYRRNNLVLRGISSICGGLVSLAGFFSGMAGAAEKEETEEKNVTVPKYDGVPDKTVLFSMEVLDAFRKDAGRFRAETGGMLASTGDPGMIDMCCFDTHSRNTSGTFYYDVESMSAVYRAWKARGYTTNGIYHSHPQGAVRPSYHDISTALLHLDFFRLDYFYLPILQPERSGFYTLYFYVVRRAGEDLEVTLHYVLEADREGYRYMPFRAWQRRCPIRELRAYRATVDGVREPARAETAAAAPAAKETEKKKEDTVMHAENTGTREESRSHVPAGEYFKKIDSLYPRSVREKVIVCVGTGGARSFLENCARSGFRNYVLMDADVVSPSNVATQGVFISEMGKKKVEVIRDRILDINPEARVVCADRFLDDSMSDGEFKALLDRFPGKKPTDYLILGCTDSFEAQKRSSLLALKYGCPYLAAMMYAGGAAAEIIFVYPGVTESCPRCLLRDRFEKYENGFVNNVDSSSCPIFATERMNALKGYIALMLLMYREEGAGPWGRMLDAVKDRNFVEIRLTPDLKDGPLGIGLFDRVLSDASRYVFFDETLWIPQHPDRPEFGAEPCRLCGGTGDLTQLRLRWADTDTRAIRFDAPPAGEAEQPEPGVPGEAIA
jgi:molybdopterin/thiamine biosynthesis adenylyltransferase/proteasome lid subunit RPN8/RPN11